TQFHTPHKTQPGSARVLPARLVTRLFSGQKAPGWLAPGLISVCVRLAVASVYDAVWEHRPKTSAQLIQTGRGRCESITHRLGQTTTAGDATWYSSTSTFSPISSSGLSVANGSAL